MWKYVKNNWCSFIIWKTFIFSKITCVCGIRHSALTRHGKVMGFEEWPWKAWHLMLDLQLNAARGSALMIGPNRVIAKYVKKLGGMPWPGTCVKHYHAQLGPPDKGRAIKGLVVWYVVWLGSLIYGMGLWTSARCVVWSLFVVLIAIELKYRNKPEIHIDTNNKCDIVNSHYYIPFDQNLL